MILSELIPYVAKITGDYQGEFQRIETVHQLFIDFKTACHSARREVLFNILVEFSTPMKLVSLINFLCIVYSKKNIGLLRLLFRMV
jgi:hypothetical protein